ncbi:sodium-dependent multivitamin transporter-like isoform X2, partial [Leptotrombidium deliense]
KRITRSDEIVTLFVSEVFGSDYPGLLGLFVTSIFSSALSTLSSGYTALAALVWEDWLKRFFPNVKPTIAVLITKFLSLIISAITIGAAYLCMTIGTIFEAIFVLIGAPTGPLFGLFTLGVCFPNANAKGGIAGLICGITLAVWITIGSIVNKNIEPMVLPVTTEGCNATLYQNITGGVSFEALKHSRIPSYQPTGWNILYHLSPFVWPAFTFTVTIIVGNIVSFATGGNKDKKVDPILLCDFINKFRC